jgi:nitrite reductase/ring-hydroxylating ferredoxin subunit
VTSWSAPADSLAAPPRAALPDYPLSWYFAGASRGLAPGAIRELPLFGRRVAVFRTASGAIGALEAACPHFGARLASGRVRDDTIECPLHRFRFTRDGDCAEQGLRAASFAVEERYGAIFVFPVSKPAFPLPRFDNEPELVSAPPKLLHLDTQWYMVSSNAFDGRHLEYAHARHAAGPPYLTRPHELAMRVGYEYEIRGRGLTDRGVRAVSGARVRFSVTAWAGNFLQVHANFGRDETFGLLLLAPSAGNAARLDLHLIVSARRGRWRPFDALRVRAKRFAIDRMLRGDIVGLDGLDYRHELRPGDEAVAEFLRWCATLPALTPDARP